MKLLFVVAFLSVLALTGATRRRVDHFSLEPVLVEETASEMMMQAPNASLSGNSSLSLNVTAVPGSLCLGGCLQRGYCHEGKCVCMEGFSGPDCAEKYCPRNCSGHGFCGSTGECVCEGGYFGADCSLKGCVEDCYGNGYCLDSSCVCYEGYRGVFCQESEGCPRNCLPNGRCVNRTCVCYPGFTGSDCTKKVCPSMCHGRGECNFVTGECICNKKHYGVDCGLTYCPKGCSGKGVCNETLGTCSCFPGYFGADCDPRNCPLECSHRGICSFNNATGLAFCQCSEGWAGIGCEKEVCPKECNSGNSWGNCTKFGCQCAPDRTGDDCSIKQCPYKCSGNGVCNSQTFQCSCLGGWEGDGCNFKSCPHDCYYRGVCNNGTCRCNDWWGGDHCQTPICLNDCNRNGKCIVPVMPTENTLQYLSESLNPGSHLSMALLGNPATPTVRAQCACNDGWGGEDCSYMLCPDECSKNGICVDGVCFCNKGYYGRNCSLSESANVTHQSKTRAAQLACEADCIHGLCLLGPPPAARDTLESTLAAVATNTEDAVGLYQCFCEAGWTGKSCNESLTSCHASCKDEQGVCIKGCTASTVCPKFNGLVCGGRGSCDASGNCACRPPFHGPDCSTASCKNDCSGHGMCNTQETTCVCYAGWAGDDCSKKVFEH